MLWRSQESRNTNMAINFPNSSRSYDVTRHAVRFCGYDRSMESSFFIMVDALDSASTCGTQCFQEYDVPSLSINGITFTSNSGQGTSGTAVNVNSAYYYDPTDLPNPYLVNVFTPLSDGGPTNLVLTITLPSSVSAFALDFSTLFSSTTATFMLSNGFIVPVVTDNATNNYQTQFFGFVSTDPFNTITLSVPNITTPDQTSYVVADVITASSISATPLPAALPLFATGLGALGLLARRRKRKAGLAARTIWFRGIRVLHCALTGLGLLLRW